MSNFSDYLSLSGPKRIGGTGSRALRRLVHLVTTRVFRGRRGQVVYLLWAGPCSGAG